MCIQTAVMLLDEAPRERRRGRTWGTQHELTKREADAGCCCYTTAKGAGQGAVHWRSVVLLGRWRVPPYLHFRDVVWLVWANG